MAPHGALPHALPCKPQPLEFVWLRNKKDEPSEPAYVVPDADLGADERAARPADSDAVCCLLAAKAQKLQTEPKAFLRQAPQAFTWCSWRTLAAGAARNPPHSVATGRRDAAAAITRFQLARLMPLASDAWACVPWTWSRPHANKAFWTRLTKVQLPAGARSYCALARYLWFLGDAVEVAGLCGGGARMAECLAAAARFARATPTFRQLEQLCWRMCMTDKFAPSPALGPVALAVDYPRSDAVFTSLANKQLERLRESPSYPTPQAALDEAQARALAALGSGADGGGGGGGVAAAMPSPSRKRKRARPQPHQSHKLPRLLPPHQPPPQQPQQRPQPHQSRAPPPQSPHQRRLQQQRARAQPPPPPVAPQPAQPDGAPDWRDPWHYPEHVLLVDVPISAEEEAQADALLQMLVDDEHEALEAAMQLASPGTLVALTQKTKVRRLALEQQLQEQPQQQQSQQQQPPAPPAGELCVMCHTALRGGAGGARLGGIVAVCCGAARDACDCAAPSASSVHHRCALYSARVVQNDDQTRFFVQDGDEIRNDGLHAEVRRGGKLRCAAPACHVAASQGGKPRRGATLGCHVQACPRAYHFPCVLAAGCQVGLGRGREFHIACPDHRTGKSAAAAAAAWPEGAHPRSPWAKCRLCGRSVYKSRLAEHVASCGAGGAAAAGDDQDVAEQEADAEDKALPLLPPPRRAAAAAAAGHAKPRIYSGNPWQTCGRCGERVRGCRKLQEHVAGCGAGGDADDVADYDDYAADADAGSDDAPPAGEQQASAGSGAAEADFALRCVPYPGAALLPAGRDAQRLSRAQREHGGGVPKRRLAGGALAAWSGRGVAAAAAFNAVGVAVRRDAEEDCASGYDAKQAVEAARAAAVAGHPEPVQRRAAELARAHPAADPAAHVATASAQLARAEPDAAMAAAVAARAAAAAADCAAAAVADWHDIAASPPPAPPSAAAAAFDASVVPDVDVNGHDSARAKNALKLVAHKAATAACALFSEEDELTVLCADLSAAYGTPEPVPVPVLGPAGSALPPRFEYITQRVGICDPNWKHFQIFCGCKAGCDRSAKDCEHVQDADEQSPDAVDTKGVSMKGRLPYASALRLGRRVCVLHADCSAPLHECNSRCSCPSSCPSRVLQHGLRAKLCVRPARHHAGWAVHTAERLPAGAFVVEYQGELIDNTEAAVRGERYDALGCSYLFNIDGHADGADDADAVVSFVVDATASGNLARFVNHSCAPNARVRSVLWDCVDPHVARLGIYTTRVIEAGEEITYDYRYTFSAEGEPGPGSIRCECRAAACRGWLIKT